MRPSQIALFFPLLSATYESQTFVIVLLGFFGRLSILLMFLNKISLDEWDLVFHVQANIVLVTWALELMSTFFP